MLKFFTKKGEEYNLGFKVLYVVSDKLLALSKYMDDFELDARKVDGGIALKSPIIRSVHCNDIETGIRVNFNIHAESRAIIIKPSTDIYDTSILKINISLNHELYPMIVEEDCTGTSFYSPLKGENTIVIITLDIDELFKRKYIDMKLETIDSKRYELFELSENYRMAEAGQVFIHDKTTDKMVRSIGGENFFEEDISNLPCIKLFE